MYYELYQVYLLGGVLDYLDVLLLKDCLVLMGVVVKCGYLLMLVEEECVLEVWDVLMSELVVNDC